MSRTLIDLASARGEQADVAVTGGLDQGKPRKSRWSIEGNHERPPAAITDGQSSSTWPPAAITEGQSAPAWAPDELCPSRKGSDQGG